MYRTAQLCILDKQRQLLLASWLLILYKVSVVALAQFHTAVEGPYVTALLIKALVTSLVSPSLVEQPGVLT